MSPEGVRFSLQFRKQFMGRGCVPLKGTVSGQKALQQFETEIRDILEGTEEENIFPQLRVIDLPSRQIKDFLPSVPRPPLIFCCLRPP